MKSRIFSVFLFLASLGTLLAQNKSIGGHPDWMITKMDPKSKVLEGTAPYAALRVSVLIGGERTMAAMQPHGKKMKFIFYGIDMRNGQGVIELELVVLKGANTEKKHIHRINTGLSRKVDRDGDGVPDTKDRDIDGDGVPNGADPHPLLKGFKAGLRLGGHPQWYLMEGSSLTKIRAMLPVSAISVHVTRLDEEKKGSPFEMESRQFLMMRLDGRVDNPQGYIMTMKVLESGAEKVYKHSIPVDFDFESLKTIPTVEESAINTSLDIPQEFPFKGDHGENWLLRRIGDVPPEEDIYRFKDGDLRVYITGSSLSEEGKYMAEEKKRIFVKVSSRDLRKGVTRSRDGITLYTEPYFAKTSSELLYSAKLEKYLDINSIKSARKRKDIEASSAFEKIQIEEELTEEQTQVLEKKLQSIFNIHWQEVQNIESTEGTLRVGDLKRYAKKTWLRSLSDLQKSKLQESFRGRHVQATMTVTSVKAEPDREGFYSVKGQVYNAGAISNRKIKQQWLFEVRTKNSKALKLRIGEEYSFQAKTTQLHDPKIDVKEESYFLSAIAIIE